MDGERFNNALLALLGRTDGAAAERALMQVLRTAEGSLQCCAMRQLLGRRGQQGPAAIARMFPTLAPFTRDTLIGDMSALEPVARVGLRSDDDRTRLAMLDALHRADRPSSAYLVVAAVTDASAAVRTRAIEVLLALLRNHRSDPAAMADHLIPTINAGLRNLSAHRSAKLLMTAVLLGRRCNRDVLAQLDAPASKLTGVFAEVLRETSAAEAADFVMLTLPYPHAGSVARSYIAASSWSGLAALGAADWWGLLAPIGSALSEIHHLRAVADDPAGLSDLPQADQPGALRLVMRCGIAANLRQTLLGEALGGDEPVAMVATRYALDGPDSTTDLVLMALHSRHADVQTVAAARILAAGADAHLTQHLLRSLPNLAESVQATVGQFLAARSFERYWQGYAKLTHDVRAAAGKALLKLDGRVADLLAGRLVSRDVNGQMQALQMVRQLRMADRYAGQLARLARQGDRRVRSAAVAALAMADDFEARRTLARCLDDGDMRVQANAVEALAAVGCEPSAVLDKLDSPNNRVRANTIKWLLEADHPQGAMSLASMLTDSRTPHRVSAVWVAATLDYKPATSLIRRLAREDPDVKVRARMATVARQLSATLPQEAIA